ncbi:MAG: hypothetical protein Q8O43_01885 [Dehalococcoidia bacterium]|nr:hypothetical protein [Dehalococcoidia bacterium]
MSDGIAVEKGQIYGPWREGINAARNMKGSIHDNATATQIGMRGGTVAGTVHLDLFAPLVQKAWGKRWFEQGSLSLFYTFATTDREEVRAIIDQPPAGNNDVQVKCHVEMRDGKVVMQGTVAAGNPEEPPHLQTVEMKNAAREELRILAGINIGDEFGPKDVIATPESVARRLENLEDTIDWYKGPSPWGPSLVPLSNLFGLIHIQNNQQFQAVPFFGASEFRMVNGPVKIGVPYRAVNKIISIGAGARTEMFWIDGWLYEKNSDKLVATMRHLNRYMKAGSPLYPEIK